MASYIRTILGKLFGKSEYRTLIMGLDSAGKTSILYRLKLNEHVTTIPTIGFNVESVIFNKASMTMWDLGGRDKIRPLWRHYFYGTQGLIFVIDSHDVERLNESKDDMDRMLGEDELRDIPLLIYLNKIDLPNGLKQEYAIKEMKLNDIRNRQWYVQSCSAYTGDGVHEGLDWLMRAMKSHLSSQSTTSTAVNNVNNDTNEEFAEKFVEHDLLSETFDHRTLIRIIWCYLKIFGRKETIKSVFDNMNFYLKNVNETLIYFWIQIVHYACEATKNPTNDFSGFLLMNPQILNEIDLPLTYYKKDTLFSNQAKTAVVLPDIKPLPSIIPSSSSTNNKIKTQSLREFDDDELLKEFESCTLTCWSHKIHLHITWLYLTRDGRRIGVNKIFDNMKNFLQSNQISQMIKFHFTLTYFWIQMVDLTIAQNNSNDLNFKEFIEKNPHLLNENLFLDYYKKKTILDNPIAQEQMVLPDIKHLPTLVTSNNKK
ncbi:unnamed protein product [Adineta steineri]|uniref:ADP-ribosylation factor n=1 Tax=Adineta steineri TaxID=433720 RepID=A0A813S0P2_9BILA|nr:unnamed protein product [Adineta steineri]CAF0824319.1 unnamed protein product [Adineta steineri]